MELQSGSLELSLDRSDEPVDIGVTRPLCGIKIVLNLIVGIVLQILEAQVLKFTLQLIQAQLVGKRSIEVACLLRHLVACLFIRGITNLPHKVHTVGNHDENDTHVLSEAQQQVAEVLTLYLRVLLI